MSDIFDVSTVDGRNSYVPGQLSRDPFLRPGGVIGPSSTLASGPAVDKRKPVEDNGSDSNERRRLQRNLDVATLDLHSARRTLRTYRRGVRGLVASAVLCGLVALAGIVTAIASSVAGVDASTAVTWLVVFGMPTTLASVAGLVLWVRLHRIKYEWRKKDSYSSTPYTVDTKGYVDPEHEVAVAELKYANALTKLIEHEG